MATVGGVFTWLKKLRLLSELILSGTKSKITLENHTDTSGNVISVKSTPGSASTADLMRLEAAGSNWGSSSKVLYLIADDADTPIIVGNNGIVDSFSISAWTGSITMAGDITLSGGGSILTSSNGDLTFTPHGTGQVVADGPLDAKESQFVNRTTVNAATYDLLISDYILHVTYTATAAVTSLTLPTAQTTDGRAIIVKDAGLNASVNNITIDTEGGQTIDGSPTLVISTDGEWVVLYSDGSNWFIWG
jgi:hypothetical protein